MLLSHWGNLSWTYSSDLSWFTRHCHTYTNVNRAAKHQINTICHTFSIKQTHNIYAPTYLLTTKQLITFPFISILHNRHITLGGNNMKVASSYLSVLVKPLQCDSEHRCRIRHCTLLLVIVVVAWLPRQEASCISTD